jgi:hypothetical protein
MFLTESDNNMITEMQISHSKIMHLIKYDVSKTNSENYVSEQVGGLPMIGGLSMLGGQTPKIINWVSTWDKHNWLTFLELVAGGIAMASPIGWATIAANALALTFGGANAVTYWQEGDKYMAGLIMFFSLIPGAQLTKEFKSIAKYGPEKAFEALRVVKGGGGSAAQKQIAKEVSEELGEKGGRVNELVGKTLKSKFLETLKKSSTKTILGFLTLAKKAGYLVGVGGLMIGGVNYGWDTIYGLLGANEAEIDKKSPLREVIRYFKNNPEDVRSAALADAQQTLINIPSDSLGEINLPKGKSYLDSVEMSWKKNKKP